MSSLADLHKKKHRNILMDPRAFEKEIVMTNEDDLQFMRSPFYDLARAARM